MTSSKFWLNQIGRCDIRTNRPRLNFAEEPQKAQANMIHVVLKLIIGYTKWKELKYIVFSGPYFPVFGLNTEIYLYRLKIRLDLQYLENEGTWLEAFPFLFQVIFVYICSFWLFLFWGTVP